MGLVVLIAAGISVLIGAMALMPNFPPTPPHLTALIDGIGDFVEKPVQLVVYVFGSELIIILFTTILAVWVAEPVYHGVMWVLRKIPVLGIK